MVTGLRMVSTSAMDDSGVDLGEAGNLVAQARTTLEWARHHPNHLADARKRRMGASGR